MSQNDIPDFNETEIGIVRQTLGERYNGDIELELADVELRLDQGSTVRTPCPTLVWRLRGADFVITKVGADRFPAQFFYRGYQQYGTGKSEFDNIGACAVTLLQVQADHEARQNKKK